MPQKASPQPLRGIAHRELLQLYVVEGDEDFLEFAHRAGKLLAMSTLELRMNQLLQDHRPTLGGRLEDYFGAAYLEAHHHLAADTALHQTDGRIQENPHRLQQHTTAATR